jgi:putative sporulation protein YyaC
MSLKEFRKSEISQIYYHRSGKWFLPDVFGSQLKDLVTRVQSAEEKKEVLYLCIGSDRSTGDSLGPLVGYKLNQGGLWAAEVLGTLTRPVHAMNLDETIEYLDRYYHDHVIVAIDASIGRSEHVGYITLGLGGIKPGLGVSKNLKTVGDVFITGIIGCGGGLEPLVLQNTRLSLVMQIADCICEGIRFAGQVS